ALDAAQDLVVRQAILHGVERQETERLDPARLGAHGPALEDGARRVEALPGASPTFAQLLARHPLRNVVRRAGVVIAAQPPAFVGQAALGLEPLEQSRT